MRIGLLLAVVPVISLALVGCGADSNPKSSSEPFAIDGSWLYLGPSDGPHTLVISDKSVVYTDVNGSWSSTWTLKAYDNALHHFQIAFEKGSGAYHPAGPTVSAAYDVGQTLLTVQLAKGDSYPKLESPGACTSPTDGTPLPDCSVYVKQ